MAAYMSCIHGVGVNLPAAQQHGGFGLVAQLLDGKDAVNVYDVVGVPDDAVEFLLDIVLEGGSDIDVVTSDVQLHGSLLRSCDS